MKLSEIDDPHFDMVKLETLPMGQVLEKQRGEYRVLSDGIEYLCGIRSRLRKNLVYPLSRERRQSVDEVKGISQVDPVAVGDLIRFSVTEEKENAGVIEHVEPRQNQLSRRSPGAKPLEAVICANIDILLVVCSLRKPKPKVGMIDRITVAAEWEEIPLTLVFNKSDLDKGEKIEEMRGIYRASGYPILSTSAVTGDGIDELISIMRDKTSVLVGPSGTGKSSILNKIQPGLGLKVRQVSKASGKGRHTTTHLQAFPLEFGGLVLDTPGIKQLALWNLEPEELVTLYPEMEPLAGKCKFGLSCKHETEPGCVIMEAVECGDVHSERYKSFLRIRDDLEVLYGQDY